MKMAKPLIFLLISGAEGQNRTADTGIFSPLLYRLSYLGKVFYFYLIDIFANYTYFALHKALLENVISITCIHLKSGVEYIIFRKYVKRFSIILMEVIMKNRLCQQKRRLISSAFFK